MFKLKHKSGGGLVGFIYYDFLLVIKMILQGQGERHWLVGRSSCRLKRKSHESPVEGWTQGGVDTIQPLNVQQIQVRPLLYTNGE